MANKQEITLHSVFELKKFHFLQDDEVNLVDISKYFDIAYPAHIYFILSRNKINIDKENSSFEKGKAILAFKIHVKDTSFGERVKIKIPKFTKKEDYNIESEYPYYSFNIKDNSGKSIIAGKSAYFANEYHEQIVNKDLLDYEVIYIGESTAQKNSAPALDRLEKPHGALQAILKQFNRQHPDKEIFFLFLSFKHNLLLDIPAEPSNKEIIMKNLMEYKSPKDIHKKIEQRTALLEWMLIYYFKPEYNDKLKNNPPTLKSSSFELLSRINLKKCTIALDIQAAQKISTNYVTKSDDYVIEHEFDKL